MISQKQLISPFRYAWNIIFPRLCMACQQEQAARDQLFCISCSATYHETDDHLIADNDCAMHFKGRIPFEFAVSLLPYHKGGLSKHLLYGLKYQGRKNIGLEFGRRMGERWANHILFHVDALIPVPLHRKKERLRGYNQSKILAEGLSSVTGIPIYDSILWRRDATETQTKKSRIARIENVENAFAVRRKRNLNGMHILLLDDVITTGATLEACGNCLLHAFPNLTLSFASLARGSA